MGEKLPTIALCKFSYSLFTRFYFWHVVLTRIPVQYLLKKSLKSMESKECYLGSFVFKAQYTCSSRQFTFDNLGRRPGEGDLRHLRHLLEAWSTPFGTIRRRPWALTHLLKGVAEFHRRRRPCGSWVSLGLLGLRPPGRVASWGFLGPPRVS